MTEILTPVEATALKGEEFRVYHLSDLLSRARARATIPARFAHESEEGREVGLTQKQAGSMVGLAERSYRDFERGRLLHPRPAFIEHLARVLEMDAAERQILYRLATRDFPHPRPEGHIDIRELQSLVDSMDFPAIVSDRAWDYVAWNRAVTRYLLDPNEAPKQERNAILLGFRPDGAALFPSELPNQRELAGRARAAYVAGGGRNPVLQDLTERLLAIPEAAAQWQTSPLALIPAYEERLLARSGRDPLRVQVLRTALPNGLHISQFVPDPRPT